ncbi:MAG: hypothetical protein COB54_07020 [Alphaproteobacteria bacterium]|nr:MAG: hypothetical protein COB54_07020 [Alphaproteobacteria bacterium]
MSDVQATTYNSQIIQNTPQYLDNSSIAKKTEESDDIVDFLSLLLVQLENQDPMDPMDTNEMTNQMVSYSQLEQSIDTNVQLENLNTSLLANTSFLAVSYLGTDMELNSAQAPVQGGTASWAYETQGGVSTTVISVVDGEGNVVYQAEGETEPGRHKLDLKLEDMADSVHEDSVLTLSVRSLDAQGEELTSTISSFVNVQMIDTTRSAPLYQAGNLTFADSDILKFFSSDADVI